MGKQVLRRPIVTEKSMYLVTQGQYMFEVAKQTSKPEIAATVEKLFGVDVKKVRTQIRPGKRRRELTRRRRTRRTSPRKLAVVTLEKGQSIEGFDEFLEVEEQGKEDD